MKLPNSENAVIDITKLREYSLNRLHEGGKHKARVFQAALGLTVNDAEWLRDIILRAVQTDEASSPAVSPFGIKYAVDIFVEHKGRGALVRTAWIIEYGLDFPRLTSCYVL